MSYDENETTSELSFKIEGGLDEDEPLEPLEEGNNDFRFDEDTDDDPDKDH